MNNITMHLIYLVIKHVSREDYYIRLNTFALYGHIHCTIEPEPHIDRPKSLNLRPRGQKFHNFLRGIHEHYSDKFSFIKHV